MHRFGALEKAGVRQPLLIFSLLLALWMPEKVGVKQQLRPLLGLREGRGEATNADILAALETLENIGVCSNSAIFRAIKKVWVMQPILSISPRLALGTFENAGVM